MYRVNIMRMTVKADEAERFEEEAKKQIKIVTEREAGTVLYGFNRRAGAPSTILSGAAANHVEYIHLMGYDTEAAQQLHLDIEHAKDQAWTWGATFRPFMAAPIYAERFESDQITTGITRAHDWNTGSMFRFAFHRFKIKEGMGEEFEEQAKRQLALVRENEPGTVLYSFMRRSTDGSALIPKNSAGHPEYLHFMAYVDEAAAQLHREIEHDPNREWAWGPTFRQYLEAPLENEGFLADQIITGNTKDYWWES
jgi:quinol monooxygenase YgiN